MIFMVKICLHQIMIIIIKAAAVVIALFAISENIKMKYTEQNNDRKTFKKLLKQKISPEQWKWNFTKAASN